MLILQKNKSQQHMYFKRISPVNFTKEVILKEEKPISSSQSFKLFQKQMRRNVDLKRLIGWKEGLYIGWKFPPTGYWCALLIRGVVYVVCGRKVWNKSSSRVLLQFWRGSLPLCCSDWWSHLVSEMRKVNGDNELLIYVGVYGLWRNQNEEAFKQCSFNPTQIVEKALQDHNEFLEYYP